MQDVVLLSTVSLTADITMHGKEYQLCLLVPGMLGCSFCYEDNEHDERCINVANDLVKQRCKLIA